MPGPTPVELRVADTTPPWVALGFLVEPGTGHVALGSVRLALGASEPPAAGLTGWMLTGDGPEELDGIPTTWTRAAPPTALAPHPNGATGVDHVVVATPDVGRTVAALQAAGMVLRREREAGTQERPLRQAFFRHGAGRRGSETGGPIVEVAGPREPRGDGPARLWGVTVAVADLHALTAGLGPAVVSPPHDAVQPGRRIATARRAAGISTPLAFITAE